MSLADIRRAIADERARIEAARAAVVDARKALELAELDERETIVRSEARIVALEAAAGTFEGEHGNQSLHKSTQAASVNHAMDANTETARRGQRLQTKNAGAKRIRAVDGSINAFAEKYKLHASTVYGWYAKGDAARKIPAKWAEKLEKKPYSIPRDAWTNGILPDEE